MRLRDRFVVAGVPGFMIGLALMAGIHAAAQDVLISEIRIDQPSTDADEYFELRGASGTALDGLTYLVIGDGSSEDGSGVIEVVVDLTGQTIPGSGFFVAAEDTFTLGVADLVANLNFENSDNVTHVLVEGFTGSSGDDLDTDDDGVLDVVPWTVVVDAIALVEEENPPTGTEYHYGSLGGAIGPDGTSVPGQVYRCEPEGTWTLGLYEPLGATDTPGELNPECGGSGQIEAVINEIRTDQPSSDLDEYFELKGEPGTSLTGATYVVIGDGSPNEGSGVIEAVVSLAGQVIPASGLFVAAEDTFALGAADYIAELAFENNDNVTHLLVQGFTGEGGQDLDPDDDGVLDIEPWESVIDSVALLDSIDDGELVYSDTTIGPEGDGAPGQVYRCEPDGYWKIGVFDPTSPSETDTPGEENEPCEIEPVEVILNEIRIDQPDADTDEYFELLGTADGSLAGVSYVIIGDGDAELGSGVVEEVIDLSGQIMGDDGYFVAAEDTFTLGAADWVTSLNFENGDNVTHLLVAGFGGAGAGDDLDFDDDGVLDIEPWSAILDSVAIIGVEAEPLYYSDQVVGPDGVFIPGQVYRCEPDGTWTVGLYDPTDPESTDTPGAINVACGAGPDSDGDGVPDAEDNCPDDFNPDQADCDEDGMGDVCAIADGFSQDCNGNGIPDECDLIDDPDLDGDGDGLIDSCYVDPPAGVVINEIRISQPDADTDEYFELKGAASTPLDGVQYVVIGDGSSGDSGVIEAVINLTDLSIPSDGHFLAVEDTFTLGSIFDADLILSGGKNLMNFEDSDNVTHMLVANFFGGRGDDVDADDDGEFDAGATPWLQVLDMVALVENVDEPPTDTEWWYGQTLVGPDGEYVPGQVYRCEPDGDWEIGAFDPEDTEAADTPGVGNPDCPPPDCPADLTGDGVVDVLDLLEVLAQWGGSGSADITGDGTVDVLDLLEVLGAWGPC